MLKIISLILLLMLQQRAQASQTFEKVLANLEYSSEEISQIEDQFPSLSNQIILKTITDPKDDQIKLLLDETFEVFSLKNRIELEKLNEGFDYQEEELELIINKNIYESVLKQFNDEQLALELSEAFQENFDNTFKLRAQAKIKFTVETFTMDDESIQYGIISKATLFVGMAMVEKIALFNLDSQTSKLIDHLPSIEERNFVSPINIQRVSSQFNLKRKHPVTRKIQPHNGIDFVARSGTPIFPVSEGTVIQMGRTRAKGKFILIEHSNGLLTTYDHLRKFSKKIKIGSQVNHQTQIGEVGRTGFATGAHLHFGVIKNGRYVTPLPYFKDLFEINENDIDTVHILEE